MKELERILKSMANGRRLKIIKNLKKKKELSVTNIAKEINLSVKATSKHLKILSAVGIVDARQESLQVFYRLAENQNRDVKTIIKLV